MSGLNRFLSRRDKTKTQDKDPDGTPPPAYHFHGLFKDDEDNASHRSNEKEDERKIRAVKACLGDAGPYAFNDTDISYALGSSYASGDATKAYELLNLVEDSEQGVVKRYDAEVQLLGAVNRGGVSCYLDSTLFAMFARLESFEPILHQSFPDEPKRRLATLLRLWVNTVRTGKLVTADITKQIQDTLATCGWKEAGQIQQQDASEAFSFITEKLELPMLALKMHIFHNGKEDENDDHKIVRERLLEVAIPDEPAEGDAAITLETCLEAYFNSRIEVKRFLQRRATLGSARSRRVSQDSIKALPLHIETAEVADSTPSTPSTNPANALPPYSHIRPISAQHRSPSIIQEYSVLDEKALEGGVALDCPSPLPSGRSRAKSLLRKEVAMSAWQFFSLIPWYTAAQPEQPSGPTNNAQVAAHLQTRRPVLGICLKRYSVNPDGTAVRRDTYIDIPIEIALPHFIADDDPDDGAVFGNFKMSLVSVVCHRGTSVHQGHYVSLARSRAADGSGEDTWLLFDDIHKEARVREVDIDQALREEKPYLLFYQILPIDEAGASASGDDRPPSYSSDLQDPTTPSASETPPEHVLINGRPSTDSARSALRGRAVEWYDAVRERCEPSNGARRDSRNGASTEVANGHLTAGPPAAATAPVSIPRKGSKKGKSGGNSFTDPNRRLSASITRLTGRITGASRPDPAAAGGDAAASLDPTTETAEEATDGEPDEAEKPAGAKKRDKDKKRRGKSREKSRTPKVKGNGEKLDRECMVM